MITVSNLGMQFGGQWLFQHVDLQFLPGNCYGIIGANGAGKSTFLRILTGELDSTNGSVTVDPTKRVSVLKQNQNAYDAYTVMDTVIMGNQHLYDVMKEKDAIYEKPDFSDDDGLRAADLEAEFAELGGWEAESDASRLLQGLGIGTELHYDQMANVDPRLKVKVLLAQALFGNPDIVMLDPPRKGCDEATLSAVVRMAPRRVVYVSCNPATAARDAAWLEKNGYHAEKVQPVDLFPRTKHVEAVLLLTKLHVERHIEVDVNMEELDVTAAESNLQ